METIEKVIRDGKVAVIVSHGYGAGWYTWGGDERLLYHPKIVEMVEQGRRLEIDSDWVKENIGIDVYACGADGLTIVWLPVGTAFRVDEYDGAESLLTIEDLNLTA
jgi:hypothetical protein